MLGKITLCKIAAAELCRAPRRGSVKDIKKGLKHSHFIAIYMCSMCNTDDKPVLSPICMISCKVRGG